MSAVRLPDGKLYQGKYHIYDPDKVDFLPRLDFLQALTGTVDVTMPIEDIVLLEESARLAKRRWGEPHPEELDLLTLVQYYKNLQSMNARLPKFSKWLTSMFVANKQVQDTLAAAGQRKEDKVVLSTDKVDIMRSGDTPHFATCFRLSAESIYDSAYSKMPVNIVEKAPGVMIAYVDDDKGKIQGRVWVQAAELPNGNNVVVVARRLGNISLANVVTALQKQGATVYTIRYVEGVKRDNKVVTLKNVGGFTKGEHFDFNTPTFDAYLALPQG